MIVELAESICQVPRPQEMTMKRARHDETLKMMYNTDALSDNGTL